MEADRLFRGMAPLILKLGCRQMIVVRLSALATLLPEEKLWLPFNWVGAGAGLGVLEKR